MTTYTPVLPEFDPVLQPIGYALACEFLGGIIAEEDPVAPEETAPVVAEAAPVVAEVAEVEETDEVPDVEEPAAERAHAVRSADSAATVELLIPVPTSLHGSPIDWFAPSPLDDEDGDDTGGYVVRRAS